MKIPHKGSWAGFAQGHRQVTNDLQLCFSEERNTNTERTRMARRLNRMYRGIYCVACSTVPKACGIALKPSICLIITVIFFLWKIYVLWNVAVNSKQIIHFIFNKIFSWLKVIAVKNVFPALKMDLRESDKLEYIYLRLFLLNSLNRFSKWGWQRSKEIELFSF